MHFIDLFESKIVVKQDSKYPSTFTAYINRHVAGKLIVDQYANPKCVFKVAVNEPYRRKGVATSLYKAAEAYWGRLSPSNTTSEDAFHFWNRYRPGSMDGDLRHLKDKLIGLKVSHPSYGDAEVGEVGSGTVTCWTDRGTCYCLNKKDLMGRGLIPDHKSA